MDYKSKYLKYFNKYQNLLKLVGGADAAQEHDLQKAIRLSEIYSEFEKRKHSAKILVIGATFTNPDDSARWGKIDPNFIGVSKDSEDPIGGLGDWNENPEIYWITVFDRILGNKKFDAIYIDQGTLHHMIFESYVESFKYESFKALIEYIANNKITDKLFLEYDALNIEKRVIRHVFPLRYNADALDIFADKWRRVLSDFRKYFRCCGEIQELLSNPIILEDTGERFSKWIAYLRK